MAGCRASVIFLVLGFPAVTAALQPVRIDPPGGWVRSPALVTMVNPNAAGVIFYTLDGSDPRGQFGNVTTNARAYLGPLSVNHSLIPGSRCRAK